MCSLSSGIYVCAVLCTYVKCCAVNCSVVQCSRGSQVGAMAHICTQCPHYTVQTEPMNTTIFIPHTTGYILHTTLCTPSTEHYTLHSTNCTINSKNCILHTTHCTLHFTHCTLHTTVCLYTLHFMNYTQRLPHSKQCIAKVWSSCVSN